MAPMARRRGRRPADLARAITGWSNFIFLFIVMSGIYLWFPRKWTWPQVRNVVLFNAGAARQGARLQLAQRDRLLVRRPAVHRRAERDADLVRLVQRAGLSRRRRSAAAAPAAPRAAPPRAVRTDRGRAGARPRTRDAVPLLTLDALWTRAEAQVPGWRTISLRVSGSASGARGLHDRQRRRRSAAPAIDAHARRADRGRSSATKRSPISRWAAASATRCGSRIPARSSAFPGQTVAGIVSAGGAVLVWTGLALAWRRFRAWIGRRSRRAENLRACPTPRNRLRSTQEQPCTTDRSRRRPPPEAAPARHGAALRPRRGVCGVRRRRRHGRDAASAAGRRAPRWHANERAEAQDTQPLRFAIPAGAAWRRARGIRDG